MNNKKEIVLVVGASSDIGSKIICEIAGEHTKILAADIALKKAEELKGKIKAELITLKTDLTKEDEINGLIEKVRNYGIPDKIVFLAAPKMSFVRFKDIPWQAVQNNIDIQLKAPLLILKALLPEMAKTGRGKVLFLISSVVLNVPPKALVNYTTIKYAVLGLMKSLASEYAEKGININAVSPSMTETGFLSDIPEKLVELNAQAHPLKRNATPDDIAPLAAFLLSDASAYISGINVAVCGGGIF